MAVTAVFARLCRGKGTGLDCNAQMLMHPDSYTPAGHSSPAASRAVLRLILPAAALLDLSTTPPRSAPMLMHGPLVLQPAGGALLALVARLQPGPPRALAPRMPGAVPGHADSASPPGLAVVVKFDSANASPGALHHLGALMHPAADVRALDAWLAQHAPEHRLATRLRQADLLLLMCDGQGPARAWLRKGDAWGRLKQHAPWVLPSATAAPGPAGDEPWVPVPQWHLPGAGMRTSQPALQPPGLHGPGQPADTREARHSRQSLALGPSVLAVLQQLRVGIVGAGLEGAALASSLVRLGVAVCVLDPADTASHHLQADLSPWCEGQPKVRALRHQLDGLPPPGKPLDGRQLPVASPAAGSLLAACDVVVAAAPGPALHMAEAWALAMLKPVLAVRTQASASGCDAWLALLPPGTACLQCLGRWPADAAAPVGAATPALRSWSVLAANMALRLLEHLVAGRLTGPLLRHLHNGDDGSLQVRDWRPAASRLVCPRCQGLAGVGLGVLAGAALQGRR